MAYPTVKVGIVSYPLNLLRIESNQRVEAAFSCLRLCPHCALCDSRYNDAKPFIEGSAGALACAECVRRLASTDCVGSDTYLAAHRMMHPADDGNPYRPPMADAGTVTCVLCEEPTDSMSNTHGKLSRAICAACLNHSSTLIADQKHG